MIKTVMLTMGAMTKPRATTLLLVLALAGCGSSTSTEPAAQPSASAAPGASTTPADTTPAAETPTAEEVIKHLVTKVPTATLNVVFTAENDPNSELGRPGKYTSKAAFKDSRIDASKVSDTRLGAIGFGGGVEVYPTAEGAEARAQYIQTLAKNLPISEYDYVAGGVLLRLSGEMTPAQAAEYAAPLGEVTGTTATGPVQPK